MIGLIAKPEDHDVACEFFELFKTPWEFYRPEEHYGVVVCVSEERPPMSNMEADLVLVYAGQEQRVDRVEKIEIGGYQKGGALFYKEDRFPVYGDIITFLDDHGDLLAEEQTRQSAAFCKRVGGKTIVRIGYDLFHEIRVLLSVGQPLKHADTPTVELHIAFLRDRIIEAGIVLIEIPPIPEGHTFIACLTHDVDHPSIRQHQWDHTAWGFLCRALLGSTLDLLRGRTSIRRLVRNWVAAAKLPFIYLGLARDFWLDFDRYLAIEKNTGSTFFVLPFKGRPGRTENGSAPRMRAAGYGVTDIADRIHAVMRNGGEIGLHGIDPWVDTVNGQQEKMQVEEMTGTQIAGVRMHWLYFNGDSPALLEKAGFAYDSTVGYNETVGYRAGIMQVYKPINASHLLELPMHVMDTALFYPSHLGLSSVEATERVGVLIEHAMKRGGVLTFNWHDRSIAPERLWGEFYEDLLGLLKQSGAWRASAHRVVCWFQKRRAVIFKRSERGIEIEQEMCHGNSCQDVPGLKVHMYNVASQGSSVSTGPIDSSLQGDSSPVLTMLRCNDLKPSGA